MLTVNSEFQNLFGLKDFVEEIKRPSWSLVEELMYYYRKIKGGKKNPSETDPWCTLSFLYPGKLKEKKDREKRNT